MDKKQALQNTFNTVAKGYDHPALSFFPETAKPMSEAELASFKEQHLQEVQPFCERGDTWLDIGVGIAIGQLD